MITGKDIIELGHNADVQAAMNQMTNWQLTEIVLNSLANHEVDDLKSFYDDDMDCKYGEFYKSFSNEIYTSNFRNFFARLNDFEKYDFVQEWKIIFREQEVKFISIEPNYREMHPQYYNGDETIEDRFITNMIVEDLETVFMSKTLVGYENQEKKDGWNSRIKEVEKQEKMLVIKQLPLSKVRTKSEPEVTYH